MPRTTLGVITPTYNHAQYVPQALEAVAAQSRRPDEHWVLDDASTDETPQVLGQYAQRLPYLRLLRHQENRGVVDSLGELVAASRCGWLYGAAADDYVLPGFFEHAMELIEQFPRVGIVFGRMQAVDAEGRPGRIYGPAYWRRPRHFTPTQFLCEFLAQQPAYLSLSGATLYRRECLEEVGGFRAELGSWCDTFAAWSIALRWGACYLPDVCMAWRRLPGSLSHGGADAWSTKRTIVERASELMRSAEFRDQFPESFVRRWRRGYLRRIALGRLKALADQAAARTGLRRAA